MLLQLGDKLRVKRHLHLAACTPGPLARRSPIRKLHPLLSPM